MTALYTLSRKTYHSYNSSYLVVGKDRRFLETGHPKDFNILHEQMIKILDKKQVPLKYIFTTHQETPRRRYSSFP